MGYRLLVLTTAGAVLAVPSCLVQEEVALARIQAALDAVGAQVFYPGCDDGRGQFETDLGGKYLRVIWEFPDDFVTVSVFPDFPPR